MSILEHLKRDFDGKWVFYAGSPTPNGRLHLGHINGPYLKMDISNRFLKILGKESIFYSGVDTYESYVPLLAEKKGKTESEIVAENTPGIERDLANMSIGIDFFIDPSSPPWHDRYCGLIDLLLAKLRESGAIQMCQALVPFNNVTKRFRVGGFLKSVCPECGNPISGYSCEDCGNYFFPGELKDHADKISGERLVLKEIESPFVRIKNVSGLLELLRGRHLAEQVAWVERYFNKNGPLIRVTQEIEWGTNKAAYGLPAFTYSLGQLAYVLMATHQSQPFSLEESVIGASSDYRFITSGGVDNFVANVLAFYALPGSFEELRPVEFLINNYFLHLDGRKFSTSSGHAVTVEQAAEKYEVNALRLYLTTIDVSHQPSDFRRIECDEFMQNVFSPMMERVTGFGGKYRLCCISKFREGAILSLFYRSLEQMGVSLDFRNYQLQSLVGILDRYTSGYAELVTDDVSYSEFVLGFCLLAAPVMPDIVEKLMLPAWGKVKLNIAEFMP